jgi:hypothetical protein
MKPAHRQAEPEYTAGFVTGLGWEAEQVSAVWEAQGDALRVGRGKVLHTFGEGPMARTEEAAQAEVAQKLGGEALGVRFVADPWFHGNTFMGYYESPDARKAVLLLCASGSWSGWRPLFATRRSSLSRPPTAWGTRPTRSRWARR